MSLKATVAIYRAAHGEPEYRHFKRLVQWTRFRRQPGYHTSPIGDGTEVTEAEYEANIAQTKHCRGEAFMGRYPQSYWEYHRKMVKDGWRERLIKDVQAFDEASLALPSEERS